MYDSLSAANEARNLAHDEDLTETTRYIVLTIDGGDDIDTDLHQLVRDLANVARHWKGYGYHVEADDRDGREVIDAEFAQDWQDTLDADGADVQPRFGYPIPAFLKAVAELGDADDMREDDRTDTLNGIIAWARDFTGATDEPSPAPALPSPAETDSEGMDRAVLDAIATMLGTSPEWRSPATYLSSIADLVGSTDRPHPGDYDPDEYAADFAEATGRNVHPRYDYRD